MQYKNKYVEGEIMRDRKTIKVAIVIGCTLLVFSILAFFVIRNLPLSETKVRKYIDSDWTESITEQENQPQYLQKLSQKATYEINSIDREDDYYTITVTVSAPNLKDYFISGSVNLAENVSDLDAFVCECIEETDYTETVAEVYIYELNGETKVSYSDAFVDAMHGGIISYSQQMLRDLYSDYLMGE